MYLVVGYTGVKKITAQYECSDEATSSASLRRVISRHSEMKRTASVDSDSLLAEPPSKRGSTLASYFTIQAPKGPNPIVSSDPLTDRRSTFVAHAAPVTTPTGAAQFQALVRTLVVEGKHPREADHEMYAARFMALRSGKDGTAPEDWTSKLAGDDDGEKGGSSAIKRCLESSGAVDVAVVVSRWYGGKPGWSDILVRQTS